jgi:uncharacterized membrane protein
MVLGLLLRSHNIAAEGLWLDELWAATFVQLSLKDTLVAVIRFDIHPPLHYFQLNVWAAVFGRSDLVLLANSVLWSMATLVAVYFFTRKLLGISTAALAVIIVAVSAGEVYFAQELRMYAMISFFAITTWYAASRFVAEQTIVSGLILVAVTALLAASHGASIVPVSCVMMFLLLSFGVRKSLQSRILVVYALVGVSVLPWLLNTYPRGNSNITGLSLYGVTSTVSGWLFGFYPAISGTQAALGSAVVFAAVLFAQTSSPALRNMSLSFIIWPVIFAATISLLGRSIWIARLFEFCAPFACIAVAAGLMRGWRLLANTSLWLPRTTLIIVGGVLTITMVAMSVRQATTGRKAEYREAAAFLAQRVQPSDVIYVPEAAPFWGIARYFVGPSWGSPLEIQDPVRPAQEPTAWDTIYTKLGQNWLQWLGLVPRSRTLQAHGVEMVIGWTPAEMVKTASRVWVLASNHVRLNELILCEIDTVLVVEFRGISVHQVACRD